MGTVQQRIAVVDGYRTPFLESFDEYSGLSAIDLAQQVVAKLVQATDLPPGVVDEVIFSCGAPPVIAPNIGREVVLRLGLGTSIPGYTLNQACISSFQTVINAAQQILAGKARAVICGGVEALSMAPVPFPSKLITALHELSKSGTRLRKFHSLRHLDPRDFFPKPLQFLEPSTGLSLGEHAENLAKEYSISRKAQDEFAFRSHSLAGAALREGRFAEELAPVYNGETMITVDGCIRLDTDLEQLARLTPLHDPTFGTVTSGNSTPLTDGASAVLVMREDHAKALGYRPLGYLVDHATIASDPDVQPLLGPVFATRKLFETCTVPYSSMDLIDLHEASAAAVLAVQHCFDSKTFSDEHLGGGTPIGEIDPEKLNTYGGSIALGHPYAATGCRMILRSLRELRRTSLHYALLTSGAAGAMGTSLVVETD
ncbi:MAG: hypothetical protein A2284_15650 [Deltaproteobacteria bacterium RIFOXYA12_FULL_61_11]|nr:MAG: hypothetical protein A2284_15650 [Deltaproteobacteria bacterium RIFOXYA12_FULL_61_11]